ncbi:MAG: DNA polymerase II large subunit [Candidatus Marsarchaeota archaeon]|nr:DNA polymerase II large subunit [Candidatus Marsarchaeota archaeon]
MDIETYFGEMSRKFDAAYKVATMARSKGYDPETFVEIKAAPNLATRVEGIIGIDGLAKIINDISARGKFDSRQLLAFELVKEVCTNPMFENNTQTRLTLAVRIGLSILTEGILVAPTEGLQSVELHKNNDGTTYAAVVYAGPIRGAGGTSAALSVALASYGRKILGIGVYKPTQKEVDRYLEEIMIYHARIARLQYLPSEDDIRFIITNCPICIDSLPTEELEVGINRNMKRLDAAGKEQPLTNKIRGGIGLVVCEGIAQKAKGVLKYAKAAGLDWSWLNNVIKVDKVSTTTHERDEKKDAVFLQELVAGRPVLAYPNHKGSFRLRYGRSRLTGIASKGFSPATMYILDEFIATGTQLKVEKPGKGCVAVAVDTIEGPFVKLTSGEALRINTIEEAKAMYDKVARIISVGDILVSYGDFKKSNTPLQQTSYVEEYWAKQLKANGFGGDIELSPSFEMAYTLSKNYNVPMHPRYIYDYFELNGDELFGLASAMLNSEIKKTGDRIFDVAEVELKIDSNMRSAIETLCIPHFDTGNTIIIKNHDAQSLIATLGFEKDGKLNINDSVLSKYDQQKNALEIVNITAPFKIMRRSIPIGARIGRPEKAKARLMKPAPNVLFPIGEYGSKDRNLYKAYVNDRRTFGTRLVEIEIAKYRCPEGKEIVTSPYCATHGKRAILERSCRSCGRVTTDDVCKICNTKTTGYDIIRVNLTGQIESALKRLNTASLPKVTKGVKGLVSKDKISEPLEKGILRGTHGISIFKDGTSRFDATDVPMTHFYPKEIGASVEKIVQLGYDRDYLGKPLVSDEQLVEMRHQDVVLNKNGAIHLLKVTQFIDDLLVKFYNLEPFYNLKEVNELIGHQVITLSPHTSCGVLGRIIGFTNANVGFAHPYTITARRRNCDGDEDTTMLLLDALINFSKRYLPVTIGGTMDAPLILTLNIKPEEVDDEVHAMETVMEYPLEFYEKTFSTPSPGEVKLELVNDRLNKPSVYDNINFTHLSGPTTITDAPAKSMYTKLKTMQEKIDVQFKLMDKLASIDKSDTAKRLILSHFIPDLMGNLHSFSKQTFRCVSCNSKYRRVPLAGKCTRCQGKLVLTISKGGIEKYLNVATSLADRYNLDTYIKQRIMLIKDEIETVFGGVGGGERPAGQFNLVNFM